MLTYEPRGAAKELLLSRSPSILLSGPAGTGKSVAMLMHMHITSWKHPGTVSLLVRQTHVSLTKSTGATYRELIAVEDIAAGRITWHGGSGSKPACYTYSNGSKIYLGGMDTPGSVLSMSVDRVYVDESVQLSVTAIETLSTRLRGTSGALRQMVLACNPDRDDHPLKRDADNGKMTHLWSVHQDNPSLYTRDGSLTTDGRDYIARLDALTGTRYKRYRLGQWCNSEGLVLDDWDDSVNVIDRFEIPRDTGRFIISVDFGFAHAFAAQFWRTDHDGRMYLVREIHKTGVLVEDHAKHMRQILDTEFPGMRPEAVVCDHQLEDRRTLERHLGLPTVAAYKAVSRGIQILQNRVRVAGDGLPRLMVFRDALTGHDSVAAAQGRPRGLASEAKSYAWQVERGSDGVNKEAPVKVGDDAADCARYAACYFDKDLPGRIGNPAAPRPDAAPAQGGRWSQPVGR